MRSMAATSHSKPVIGIVGGIGSGKSTVAGHFGSLGCGVIDADALARAALQDEEVKRQLVAWWGEGILDAAGRVDRKAVGRIVFDDDDALAKLESVVHPKVHAGRQRVRRQFETDDDLVAIVDDTPLLLEKQLDSEVDVLVYVDVPRDERLRRLRASRGWDEAELARREKKQLPLDIKRQRADYCIDNGVDASACLQHVRRVLPSILQAHQPGRAHEA